MIKGLFKKIKSIITRMYSQEDSINRAADDKEDHEEEYLKSIKDSVKKSERGSKDYKIKINLVYKNRKFYLLNGSYGKDKSQLIKILLRTRSPRIKKKLIKRIVN